MSKYNSKRPRVLITRPGETYTTYEDWYNFYCKKFPFPYAHKSPKLFETGEILTFAEHSSPFSYYLFAILIDNYIYILNEKGFEPENKKIFNNFILSHKRG